MGLGGPITCWNYEGFVWQILGQEKIPPQPEIPPQRRRESLCFLLFSLPPNFHQYLSQTNPSWRAKNIRILEKQPAGLNPTVVQTQVGER